MDAPLIPPPAVAGAAALLQLALARGRRPSRCSRAAAALLGAASMGIASASAARFLRLGTTVDPHRPAAATTLVTSGAFARTRNPMYLGLAGVLLAHAVARRSWAAGLPVLGFLAVMDRVQVPAEERALLERFGSAYADYLREVPRWGRLSPRRGSPDGRRRPERAP